MTRTGMLTVAVLATWGLALAGQAAPVWVEGEDFVAESVLRDGEGKAGLKGDGKGYAAEGWGDTAMMSGGKVLHVNLGGGEVEKFVPEAGLVFARDVDLSVAGPHEIWARIGYEFARSEFDWRWDDGDWATVKPSEPTVDVQPIQTWNELGWLRLATLELRAGKHRLAFRHRPRQVGEPGKEKTERILHMLDAVCIAAPGVFSPCGKWAPGVDHRDEQDRAAEVQVFKVASAPGPDGRAWTQLDGLWQYAPWGETEFPIAEATRLKPVEALPDLGTLRWFAYQAPGSREEQLPEQAFTHRYLLRCRLDVPAETAGRGFFLDVQRSTLIVSAFVNGQRAGSTDTFHTAWQMDLSRFVKPGQANELVLAIKDPYYSLNPQDDANAAALGNRQYWNLPRDFLQANQGVAAKHDLPVAADCRSGLLEPASIVVAGPVYAVDVFAQPRDGKLGLEVTVLNPTDRAVEVEIRNDVVPWNGGEGGVAECAFAPRKITLPPGQAETVQLEQAWANPTRWWPDQPFLYWVRTTLAVDGQPVDEKRTRFGFRTIGWADDQFRINGIKWPMWADQNLPGSPQAVVELSRRSHMNQVRFWSHGGWGPMTRRQALSYFDETGMLVRSSGSFDGQLANYGSGLTEKNENGIRVAKTRLWDAWRRQMTAWIRAERNHPSIYIWSVENEIAYINVNNLGQWRECEPELTKGVRHVMAVDPTRPAMVDGGNCLRDESLPVNGAHYTEFMNVAFRDFPDAAYTKAHFYDQERPQRGAWRKVPGRPIMGGEIYFAEGYTGADFATIGGDRCFIGLGETMVARGLWAKMLSEGYRWCEYGSFHFWLGNSERQYWNSWSPVAVFCRQWNWSWGGGATIGRTLKAFNHTSDPAPITAAWEFHLDGQKVAGESKTFAIPPGEAQEFTAELTVPEVAKAAAGTFILTAARGGQEVFREEKPVRILAPAAMPNPGFKPGELAVFDPRGKVMAFLRGRGIPFAEFAGPDAVPAGAKVVVVGPDAIAADMATDPRWLALAADGKRILVLDQETPLAFRALIADLEPTRHTGRFGFSEDLTHPAFAGLTQADFFTWGNDHVLYRHAYRKGTKGGRSLLQCDEGLACTALFESQVNDGLLILSQLAIGGKLADEAVAQQMFLNLLAHAAAYRPVRRPVHAVLPDGDRRAELLARIDLAATPAASPLAALQDGAVAIVDASAANLKTLADNPAAVEAFCRKGGWLMLWGLAPDGLADFNRLVRANHVLRKFERERVLLSYPMDRLASGLTLRDVVMDTGQNLYPWMALKTPDEDGFGWLVDHTDIAPFCTFPDGLAMGKGQARPGGDHEPRNMVNGFTSDDNWVFTYTTILDQGHRTRFTLDLPKEEEITALRIRPSKLYHPVTKMNIYFDDDPTPVVAEIPVREQPIVEDLPIPGRKARKVTLEIAAWGERGDRNIVVVDNLWLMVKRPDDYLARVSSLLNVGALMAYRLGDGGIFLNQLNLVANEANPDNAAKKATIAKTILANLGAVFKGGRLDVAAERFAYRPVAIPDARFNTYKHQHGQPPWFGTGDIAAIPVGNRTFAGVDFALSDLTTSPVPSVFTIAGHGSHVQENEIKGLAVAAQADVLCFLHAYHAGPDVGSWRQQAAEAVRRHQPPPAAPHVATYRVNYADGSHAEAKVLFGEHVDAWDTATPGPLPGADLGWSGRQGNGAPASVWVMRWTNPHPDRPIAAIDFQRAGGGNLGAPALLGIAIGNRRP